ncbi:hypothetical protein CHUAL_005196 [Chamberlinius hualienensis]
MLLYWLILACFVKDSSEETLTNYMRKQTDEIFVHPLASTVLKDNPPITIEVTPFNDTLINVYFSSVPQRLAIIIYLTNSPHPMNTAYSSILIVTNPSDKNSPVYSGTITFMSPTENSTVGFHIPTTPNGAIITVDVPKGPMPSNDRSEAGKTKIRLIHLGNKSVLPFPEETTIASTQVPTTKTKTAATDRDKTWLTAATTVASDFPNETTSQMFNSTVTTESDAFTTPVVHTTDFENESFSTETPVYIGTTSETSSSNFPESLSTAFSISSEPDGTSEPTIDESTDEFTDRSSLVPTIETFSDFTVPPETSTIPAIESTQPFDEPEVTSDILVSRKTTDIDIVVNDWTEVTSPLTTEIATESSTSLVPRSDTTLSTNILTTEKSDISSPTLNTSLTTVSPTLVDSSTSTTKVKTVQTTTNPTFVIPVTDRASTSLPLASTQSTQKITETITNATCPTLYNIYLKLNITASINKTRVDNRDDMHRTTESPTKSSLTATSTTDSTFATKQINDITETSLPRNVPPLTVSESVNATKIFVAETTTPPTISDTFSDKLTTTLPTTTSVTTMQGITTTVPTVKTPEPMPPTSFWLVSIIIAKVDITNATFVEDITRALEAAYDEAYKRQHKQIFGIFSVQNRNKREDNKMITLQMINVTKNSGQFDDEIELVYYLVHNGTYIPVNASLNAMELLDDQEAALLLGHRVIVKAKRKNAPTSEPYHKSDQQSDILPTILGSIAGILIITVIVIIVLRLKCMKKKIPLQESSPASTNLGERNRIQALDDELMTVVVDGRGEGSSRSKLESENMLPIPLDTETFRTPPPKPKRRRPLPALPDDYAKPQVTEEHLADQRSFKRKYNHPIKVLTHSESENAVYDETQHGTSGGLLEYLNAPFSQIPRSECIVEEEAPEKTISGVSVVATQTDIYTLPSRRVSDAEQELEVVGNELQWHTVKKKMQELIDEAFAVLKNKKPSPRFRGSRLQPLSTSAVQTDSSIVNIEEINDLSPQVSPLSRRWLDKPIIEVQSSLENAIYDQLSNQQQPLQIDANTPHKTPRRDIYPVNEVKIHENIVDPDLVRTYRRPPKDLETAYLLKAIKDELKNFKQNFSTLDGNVSSQSINI